MKTLFFFLLFICTLSKIGNAQPSIQWQKTLGGLSEDIAYSIQQTSDGGFIIAGYSSSIDGDVTGNHGDIDYWIIKLNSIGLIQWQKSLGGSSLDIANSVQQTTDGGYIVAGVTGSNDGDVSGIHAGIYSDCWIAKLDGSGIIQWQKTFGGTGPEYAYSIQQTYDNGYVFAGVSASNDGDVTGNHGNYYDYWIVKLDSNGVLQWNRSLGGSSFEFAYSIQQTSDKGYIVAGHSDSNDSDVTGNHGGIDCWIVKLDSLAVIQWQKSIGGTNEDYANSIRQTSDGGFIFAGYSNSNNGDVTGNHGGFDYWIVKLDSSSTLQWQKSLGGSNYDKANSISQTSDGGYIIAGVSASNNGDVTTAIGLEDFWIVKLDNTGTVQWKKSLGGTNNEGAQCIQQSSDGGYVIVGYSGSNDGDVTSIHGILNLDYWIVKLDSSINVNIPLLQKSSFSFQITSNPFINETVISFEPSIKENVFMLIHDTKGQLIKNLNTKILCCGTNEIIWDATNNTGNKVKDGIYFITIVSDNFSETKKVVLLKN